MAKRVTWHDEYWLLLLQLYLRKPQGMKPLYSKPLVDLALELHIAPDYLHRQLRQLERHDTPTLKHLWDSYAERPKKLNAEVKRLRAMKGFGHADEFYAGVKVNEQWEWMFRPASADEHYSTVCPAMLFMILSLYYQLIPATMVSETPEVQQLARELGIKVEVVVEVMEVFRFCDPMHQQEDIMFHPLLNACMRLWRETSSQSPDQIAQQASLLADYWA